MERKNKAVSLAMQLFDESRKLADLVETVEGGGLEPAGQGATRDELDANQAALAATIDRMVAGMDDEGAKARAKELKQLKEDIVKLASLPTPGVTDAIMNTNETGKDARCADPFRNYLDRIRGGRRN